MVDIYTQAIIANLYASVEHVRHATDMSALVQPGGDTIAMPVEGAKGSVTEDPGTDINSNYPAPNAIQKQTLRKFNMHEVRTDVKTLRWFQQQTYTWSMVELATRGLRMDLNIAAAKRITNDWLTTSQVVTDQEAATTLAGGSKFLGSSGADGANAKAFTKEDLVDGLTAIESGDWAVTSGAILMHPLDYGSMLKDKELRDEMQFETNPITGARIPYLWGFRVYKSTLVPVYTWNSVDENYDLRAIGGYNPATATDRRAILMWDKEALAFANDDPRLFEQLGDPDLQGDKYSAAMMAGGSNAVKTLGGIAVIVQGENAGA